MSKIEWTEKTWNPVTGCTPISAGCKNCYARRMARRLAGRFGYPEAPNQFDVTLQHDRLDKPSRWRKPQMISVCSMSDLFHEDVPFEFIRQVYAEMFKSWHTFQVLTKRPKRMLEFYQWYKWQTGIDFGREWNLAVEYANVWPGVTVENQTSYERVPILLQVPATVRFVSVEPMLERIEFGSQTTECDTMEYCQEPDLTGIDWVICGGETGPGARPMKAGWARDLRDQCQAAGVSFFFKKMGSGRDTPSDLMIREYPGA